MHLAHDRDAANVQYRHSDSRLEAEPDLVLTAVGCLATRPPVDHEDHHRVPDHSSIPTPRLGARVLLLDPTNRVLLIHALDPDDHDHHWWELPGGGVDPGDDLRTAARRELAEETGIVLDTLERQLWIRESRFRYRNRDHHRIDHVFLARTTTTAPRAQLAPTENEKLGLIECRWWTATELRHCLDTLLPASLPSLLTDLIADQLERDLVLTD